jgi:hypothetical protein
MQRQMKYVYIKLQNLIIESMYSLTAFSTKWIYATGKAKALEESGHGCACKKSCRKNHGYSSFGQVR